MTPPRARVAPPDHTLWQRRAHATLGAILRIHSHLTPIRWTLAPIGCGLTGEITGPDAYLVERAFAEWLSALRLRLVEHADSRRRAISPRGTECRITLIATLPDHRKDTT